MNTATFQDAKGTKNSRHDSQKSPAGSNHDENQFAYRSVSRAAVASMVFAVLGALTCMLAEVFVLVPTIGVGFGLVALASFRRFPEELIGKLGAKIGLAVSLICLVGSASYHTYIYNTEVPDGYQRISYGLLRPNLKTPLPFSEKALELDGKKVFLRGYTRPPGGKKTKLTEFILVGDFGDCCFGGNPKITDVVAVRIVEEGRTVDYGRSLRRIGGTFRLNKQTRRTKEKDVPQVFYEIEADHVR